MKIVLQALSSFYHSPSLHVHVDTFYFIIGAIGGAVVILLLLIVLSVYVILSLRNKRSKRNQCMLFGTSKLDSDYCLPALGILYFHVLLLGLMHDFMLGRGH